MGEEEEEEEEQQQQQQQEFIGGVFWRSLMSVVTGEKTHSAVACRLFVRV